MGAAARLLIKSVLGYEVPNDPKLLSTFVQDKKGKNIFKTLRTLNPVCGFLLKIAKNTQFIIARSCKNRRKISIF